MRQALKIAAGIGCAVIGVLLLLVILLSTIDLNRARPWINDRVSTAIGRDFAIRGDLDISWERATDARPGWRGLIPFPRIQARDLTLGNVDWARSGPVMATVGELDILLNPLPLFTRTLSLQSLSLVGAELILEKNDGDENNWTFRKQPEEGSSEWKLALRHLVMKDVRVRFVDPVKKADASANLETTTDGRMKFALSGMFNEEKVSGGGQAGSVLSLKEPGLKYPVDVEIKVGETTITADGTLTDPAHPTALDINLKLLGASMADLFAISGLVLPETPKFSTSGRVIGTFAKDDIRIRYEKFEGKVGESDIGGSLEYLHRKPRPLLRGEVVSNHLNLGDMAALIGADKNNDKKSDEPKIPPGKVLPVSPFKTERWDNMDVQVQFSGKKIVRSGELPVDHLQAGVRMDNGVLSLVPVEFGIAGGRLTAEVSIDGRKDPAHARSKITIRGLKLKEMLPEVESAPASIGEINGDARVSATGNSVASLLASMNGEVKSVISQGSISKFVLEAAGLNIGSAVIAKLFGDHQVQLNCMVADLELIDGVMRTKAFVLDTDDAIIGIDGNINFDQEKLNLTIRPESKGVRIISLRSPLHVQGTFKNPDIGVDAGSIAMKAGAATILATIAAPVASLLALINPGPADEDSPCAALVPQAKEKPQAPPPGKSGNARKRN